MMSSGCIPYPSKEQYQWRGPLSSSVVSLPGVIGFLHFLQSSNLVGSFALADLISDRFWSSSCSCRSKTACACAKAFFTTIVP